ncbi:MAG TPA: alpha/beta hydrolase fold domain-containing protein [Nitrospiria bacterium]|nr:alpha/beta hydrolase fold domain-containing protein [Nitrospiria bacterium]
MIPGPYTALAATHLPPSLLVTILTVSLLCAACAMGRASVPKQGDTQAAPPGQPPTGPGSSQAPHAGVSKHQYGEGALGYWIYTPTQPVPAKAPVILYLHGWNGQNPFYYGGWIEHLVKRENIVIFPVYQESKRDEPERMIQNAIQGTKDAIERLEQSGPVQPELDKFAIVGHSLGGGLTAQIAARAEAAGLPVPKAIMPVEPGWRGGSDYPTAPLAKIPPSTLMLVIVGDDDQFAKTRQAKPIFDLTKQIPPDHKRYIIIQSDHHGTPPLIADHIAPHTPRDNYSLARTERQKRWTEFIIHMAGLRDGEENALDYYGFWKLFDALCDAAFSGKTNIEAALSTARVGGMGVWSDGTPVKTWIETSNP